MAIEVTKFEAKTGTDTIMMAQDRPLNAEENELFELARRRVYSGYYDEAGLFYKPKAGGSAQPQAAAQAATAASAATSGTPTAGTGFVAPALTLSRVQPGDLITAGFANGLIDALMVVDARLRALEARSGTVVTPTVPAVPATPVAPVTPVNRVPVITAALYHVASTGRASFQITGSNLAQVTRVEMNEKTIKIANLAVTEKSVIFTTSATAREAALLNGMRISLSGKDGEDTATLRPATGKDIDRLEAVLNRLK